MLLDLPSRRYHMQRLQLQCAPGAVLGIAGATFDDGHNSRASPPRLKFAATMLCLRQLLLTESKPEIISSSWAPVALNTSTPTILEAGATLQQIPVTLVPCSGPSSSPPRLRAASKVSTMAQPDAPTPVAHPAQNASGPPGNCGRKWSVRVSRMARIAPAPRTPRLIAPCCPIRGETLRQR